MLTPEEISAMRGTAVEAMPSTVAVTRRTHTESGLVDGITEFTKGRLVPAKQHRDVPEGLAYAEFWRLYLPADFELEPADKVTIEGRDYYPHEIRTARSWEITGYALVGRLKTPHTVSVASASQTLDDKGVVVAPVYSGRDILAYVENADQDAARTLFGDLAVVVSAPMIAYIQLEDEELFTPDAKLRFEGNDYYVRATRRIPISGIGPHAVVLADRNAAN